MSEDTFVFLSKIFKSSHLKEQTQLLMTDLNETVLKQKLCNLHKHAVATLQIQTSLQTVIVAVVSPVYITYPSMQGVHSVCALDLACIC